ncbi:RNA polymerase sigma factor [Aurantiacibacter xanthus]|uniref:RNA polymerase sigma factor n=1 Tax=Aurantiacibacter xanthus TaxID=1784712 RepID=UPI001FEB3A7C|nr:RNA polymerase sigma factor [Aurantiacibacter xanthus]
MRVNPTETERLNAAAADAADEEVRQVADVAALYEAEAPRLWRFFRRRTASPDEAEDLVHETFTRALGQGPRTRVRNPGGYLTRIAQNLLRDRAKIARRRSADLHVSADPDLPAGTDPVHLLEVRNMLDRLEVVMLELPETTREVFMAHRLEGLTYTEIAGRTGLTVKQVEKAIARAMVALDRGLGPR